MNPNYPYPPGGGPGQPAPGAPAGYPQQQGGYPQAGAYPQQQGGYPQAGAYPQQQAGYPQQPAGYPQQPAGYQQQPAGYQQQAAYPQAGAYPQPAGYPEQAGGAPPGYGQPLQPGACPQQPPTYGQQQPHGTPMAPNPPAAGPSGLPAPAPGAAEYTVAIQSTGWGKAFGLYWQTIGCTMKRAITSFLVSGVTFGLLAIGMVGATVGKMVSNNDIVMLVACLPFIIAACGWLWYTSGWVFKTYIGHVAVLAELIRHGKLETGGKGQPAYGMDLAAEVFGDVEGVTGVQRNFDHVLGSAQDAIASAVSFLPANIAGWLRGLMRKARTYLAWVMVSYVVVTRRPGRQRDEVNIVVLHAFAQTVQSWKKMLTTIVWTAVVEGLLLVPVWIFGGLAAIGGWFGAAYAITASVIDTSGSSGMPSMMGYYLALLVALLVGIIFGSITTVILVGLHRDLFVRPLCLARAMLVFHNEVASRPFDRAIVAKVSRLEELAEKIDRHGGSVGHIAGAAGGAMDMMKGFMNQ